MRRLALIRLMMSKAEQESRLSAPFSTDSINRFHDVVEMFLALAVQHHHLGIPKQFEAYWSELGSVLGRPLAYKAQMQKFNKVRVNLKHYGIEPAIAEIEASRSAVRGLLYDETPALFGVNLDDVSLKEFVACAPARALLDSAENRWAGNDPIEAFADLSDSFGALIADYRQRKQIWYGRSVFDSTESMSTSGPFFRGVTGKQKNFEESIIKSLKALDFAVTIVGLGIDMRRYGKFKGTTPNVYPMANGGRHVTPRNGVVYTQDDFDFCRDFVVTAAIHLSEFDYDFDLWEAYRESVRQQEEASLSSDDEDET
jgi:hypothetical protein